MDDSSGLRRILLDEITSLRAGTTEPGRAKAVAALANQVLKSVEVEMAFIEMAKGGKVYPDLGGMKLVSGPAENILKNTEHEAVEPRAEPKNTVNRVPDMPAPIPKHMLPPATRTVRGRSY